jgi:hypothetical protein
MIVDAVYSDGISQITVTKAHGLVYIWAISLTHPPVQFVMSEEQYGEMVNKMVDAANSTEKE